MAQVVTILVLKNRHDASVAQGSDHMIAHALKIMVCASRCFVPDKELGTMADVVELRG